LQDVPAIPFQLLCLTPHPPQQQEHFKGQHATYLQVFVICHSLDLYGYVLANDWPCLAGHRENLPLKLKLLCEHPCAEFVLMYDLV
jgi:hypothetical protein